ncbi:MAG TPA: prepilin peptidase [Stellaceae bacterium]|jgi:prepilin peptidase CpaA|nr:prepilin peptidase [Stellaceae bacterium]
MLLHYVQALVLAAFTAVMAAAAFEDFRRFVIPNLLPIVLCALWPIYFAAAPSIEGGLAAVACALAVFLVGAVLFARGLIGGGDVKLLSAATLWAGPAGTPTLLMLTSVLGGALTLFLLMPFGRRMAAAIRGRLGQPSSPAERGLATRVPYGIAIAGAALIVTLPPFFG